MGSYHHLLLLIIPISLLFSICAADTLIQGQKIKDGETLISTGKVFELGFFTPDGSGNRYLGIWYYGITPLNTIWVANRDRPLDSSSSSSSSNNTFGIGNDGNLILLSSNQTIFWSTQLLSSANNTVAQLEESGNLVLHSTSSNTVLWQSFDHPTDTFLPGMKVLYDIKTRKSTTFTSWRSPIDPSSGNYTAGLGLDSNGSMQIYMWEGEGSRIRWRSGQWNGAMFIGTKMRALNLYGFKYTNDPDGTSYFTFKPYNESLFRFVTQWNGVENVTILSPKKQWSTIWAQPLQDCELYNKCGANAQCTDGGTPSICSCLQGYEPRSPEDWAKGNWTGGCSRRTALSCEEGGANSSSSTGAAVKDGFLKLEALKVPDRSEWISTSTDITACQDICYSNCSCRAYAFFTTGIGCLVWSQDLLDIHCNPDGSGNDLYIKLSASELPASSKSKKWVTILVVVLVLVAILLLVLFLLWTYRARVQEWWKAEKKVEVSPIELYRAKAKIQSQEPVSSSELGDISREGNGSELALHKFDSIAAATDNFNPANLLGRGGFGDVYKGVLPWGEEIAVKRLSSGSGQGQEEFKNEAILIAKLQHRNLVRLLGCCIEKEEKILIYEYMPNKSLDAFLFDLEKKSLLDWKTRFNIIEGIARGLVYLHRDSRLRIVHRDLKVSNILLDTDMNPKISDFGMARIFGSGQHQENTTRIVGTYGYMSPEYAMEGVFSVKSDVYSFGVLLLEIISGKKNNSFHGSDSNCLNLVGHAWRLWDEGRTTELIDPSISDSPSVRQILRCIHVGLLCIQDRPMDRPDMPSVVIMLGSETTITVKPKQPAFNLFGRSPTATEDSSMPDQDIFTSSDVTITSLTSR